MKNVILFIAHRINECTLRNYYKLLKEKPCNYDLFWGLHDDIIQDTELPKDIKVFHFSFSTLQALGYTPFFYDDGKTFGSVNFILQAFFKKYPDYDYYWSMEYDVIFTGNWYTFFGSFERYNADFISSHIEFPKRGVNDNWIWWNPLIFLEEDIPVKNYVKAFNPLYRISKSALSFMDGFLKQGNYGHFETLMSTALFNHGFQLLDYGGTGKFVPNGFKNRFYTASQETNSGTIRFRPEYKRNEIERQAPADTLFHPVKD